MAQPLDPRIMNSVGKAGASQRSTVFLVERD